MDKPDLKRVKVEAKVDGESDGEDSMTDAIREYSHSHKHFIKENGVQCFYCGPARTARRRKGRRRQDWGKKWTTLY